MTGINGSVGAGGINREADVRVVQELLNRHVSRLGLGPLMTDGRCGPRTIEAIRRFQKMVARLVMPDGRVDPGGRTMRALSGAAEPAKPAADDGDWSGDSSKWTQAKKLASLNGAFRVQVEKVIATLEEAGYQPSIVFGWRSVAVQKQLVKAGRSQVSFSFHNAQTKDGIPDALAVDLIDSRWAWKEPECMRFFNALGKTAKAEGLVWGGDWTGFRDWAHIQGRANGDLAKVKKDSGL